MTPGPRNGPCSSQGARELRRSSPEPARRSKTGAVQLIAMKTFLFSISLVLACLPLPLESASPPGAVPLEKQASLAELRARAETSYQEGSYQTAHELYRQAAQLELAPAERAWVDFRLADTRWRAAAQSNDPDTSELDRSTHELRAMLERYEHTEQRDELFAEIHESLGDASWRRNNQDWSGAWSHYDPALEWWAESSDLERARGRYLGLVWKAALPSWREEYWGWNYFPNYLPVEVLENARKIAVSDVDRGRAHYLLGRAWMNQAYQKSAAERVERELGVVLELGKEAEFYDDALYSLGTFYEGSGRFERAAGGGWQARPDYVRAVELFRRLLSEFRKGETRYFDDAEARVRNLTAPSVSVQVERFFLPESEVQYLLAWRNVASVELALHAVDLTRDVVFKDRNSEDWLAAIQPGRAEPAARWSHATQDDGKHEPGSAQLVLEKKPAPGAYLLLARADGRESRALVLVSDAAITVKATGTKLLAWATEVQGGAPLPEAELRLWERWHDGSDWRRKEHTARSGADGVALFELSKSQSGGQFFVGLKSGARASFAQGWIPGRASPAQAWKVYAYTDRAAYRPEDTVQWKLWARTRFASEYRTPADELVSWEIRDPHGAVVNEGSATLNAFGAAWSNFQTGESMALGEYRVQFFQGKRADNRFIGDAALFRLEEYKLPEYEVLVKVPEDPPGSGKPRLFRLGERVEVEVESSYYYGAPVADATVEVFVHQQPRYRPFHREREFPWYYGDAREISWWGGPGQQILHETKRTDPAGRTTVAFDTPADAEGEFEYTIEARVTDASRREIVGQGRVVVAREGYRVDVTVAHAIHRPGTEIEAHFRAQDPNGNPVSDDGQVTVTRERWVEIWLDPSGREVTGEALAELQSDARGFPPVDGRGDGRGNGRGDGPGWRPKFQGYEHEVVARGELRTDAEGRASFRFTPPREGYYRIVWTSTDDRQTEIRGEGQAFVADERTRELGYLPGGIEILVDRDTVEAGKDAAILLLAPTNGRWVLFTVEGEDLYQHQVFQLSGQVKLVQLPVTELHVPNVFLGATSIHGGRAFQDSEELVVPPVEQFLTVELTGDRAEYVPGEEGTLAVLVKDRAGEPVSAELSLALVDEAVAYIQGDYALDPRQFFYGEKRALWVQTSGTFQHGWFGKWSRDDEGKLRDDRQAWLEQDREQGADGFALGERMGLAAKAARSEGVAGRVLMDSVAAPQAVAEELAAGALGGAGGQGPAVRVRSDFRETALWVPDVRTDAGGRASVPVKFPDSTTRWRALARGSDTGTRVGTASTSVRTRQPLIVRLQAPRFFVVGDELTLSGNLDNNLAEPVTVQAALEGKGLKLLGFLEQGALREGPVPPVVIPANGQARIDWRVAVLEPGTATLKLAALGEEVADAVERTFPVHAHGIEAFVDLAGKLDAGELALALDLPRERRPDSTALEVTVAPSLAVTMLDALPYLADYPYGCTEQTLSRFLPAVIVAKTLRDLGLSAEDAMTRVFGGIEPEFAEKTHPGGKQALERLDEMARAGLERLYDFQHEDGGWAWWKEGESDHFMSAYVLWGLSLARAAGLEVREGVLEHAAGWLARELVERETELDLQAWMLHALAAHGTDVAESREFLDRAFANLWGKRDALNAYSRALLALAAQGMGREQEARVLADNLRNGAIVDESPDTSIVQVGKQEHRPYVMRTAHWGEDGIFHRWSEGGVEATAFALRALVAIDPENELVEPVMNWLVKNRRGAQWSNTRDTAISVLALNDYLRASGELGSAVEYELAVNGRSVATKRLEREQLLAAPGAFVIDRELLRDGRNEIRIAKKSGSGPLYFAARASFFSLEEPIPSRGSELFLRREYWRLAPRPTLLKGTVYDRILMKDGESIRSGERVEVVLTLEAKNELEYLVLEDLKPAGFEAVQVRSGEPLAARELKRSESELRFGRAEEGSAQDGRRSGPARGAHVIAEVGEGYTGRARGAHQELRDRLVACFLDKLPQGTWELRYELRAEVPGSFHALPVLGHAMYVPEIRGNGEEARVNVVER